VLAQVVEQSPEVVDTAMARLSGTVVRRPVYEVESEIAAAQEAQREAKKEARKKLREARHDKRQEEAHAKVQELKAKLHLGGKVPAASS
jgi:F0F1-type ATP synthase epsilon subunit